MEEALRQSEPTKLTKEIRPDSAITPSITNKQNKRRSKWPDRPPKQRTPNRNKTRNPIISSKIRESRRFEETNKKRRQTKPHKKTKELKTSRTKGALRRQILACNY